MFKTTDKASKTDITRSLFESPEDNKENKKNQQTFMCFKNNCYGTIVFTKGCIVVECEICKAHNCIKCRAVHIQECVEVHSLKKLNEDEPVDSNEEPKHDTSSGTDDDNVVKSPAQNQEPIMTFDELKGLKKLNEDEPANDSNEEPKHDSRNATKQSDKKIIRKRSSKDSDSEDDDGPNDSKRQKLDVTFDDVDEKGKKRMNCRACKYQTTSLSHFRQHLGTKKHSQNATDFTGSGTTESD